MKKLIVEKFNILAKGIFLVLFFSLLGLNKMHAQHGKFKLANRYYSEMDFKKAGIIYDDILENSPDDAVSLRRSAFCHERFGDLEIAENRYKNLSKLAACTSKDLLNYAEVLKKLKKYNQTARVYQRYYELEPEAHWVKPYFEDGNWTKKILRDSAKFDIRISKINSEESDFSPTFVLDQVIFSSGRPEGKSKKATNEENYLNLFEASILADGSLINPVLMESKANSKYHEGTACYDNIDKKIYFTRNNYNGRKAGKAQNGNLNLALYFGSYDKMNGMGELEAFKYNNPEYSVGHPTISKDGQTLVFISDMPGGYGGTDLYMCKKDGLDWSEPINLGPEINTPENEMFPFIYNDNELYFSSNGHPGLGGLDIFIAHWKNLKHPKVSNVGYPLNSAYDDFGFILFRDGKKGYVSSNRPGGKGSDDIYEINIKPPSIIAVSGRVIDKETRQPIANATILLKDSANSEVRNVLANSGPDGRYDFEVAFNEKYTIVGVKTGYFEGIINLTTRSSSGFIEDADIELLHYDYASEGRVLDISTGEPLSNAMVTLYREDDEVLQSMRTDKQGRYFFGLDDNSTYTIVAEKQNYSSQKIPVDTRNRNSTVIYADFRLFKLAKGTIVPLENVLWDYNSAKVNAQSAKELDNVVQYMKDYPTMLVELSSHTDCRGTSEYNMKLSTRRANSAVKYIVSKGIPANRIISKGYGETQLKNRCADGVDCSEAEHQVNRRTEFKILEI